MSALSIDLVRTASDGCVITAFDGDTPIRSITAAGEIVDGIDGERLEALDDYDDEGCTWPLAESLRACRHRLDDC
jgi:hypothetical protein